MKVLLVTPSYYPIVGGSETLTRTLLIKLNEIGIHTDVMTLNMNEKWNPIWREETENNGIFKIFKVRAFNPFSALAINPLYPLLRMNVVPKPSFARKFEDYDIIHFIGEADLSLPVFSIFVQKPKIIHSCATLLLHKWYTKHVLLRKIFKLFFPHLADLYIVVTPSRLKLLSDLGVPSSKMLTLPFGVDIKIFRPDRTKKRDNLILFVGRITEIKGLHVLLQALSYLETQTHFVIIGPMSDIKYAKKIKQMYQAINDKGIHRVTYLGGMDKSSLVHWYQKATVLTCPYLVKSSSLVTMEALACGIPVIGTGNHVIKDGVNGIIVPPNNPQKLAEALHKLLEDKELREKYGREGRRIIEQYFSWKSIITRLVKVYKDMLSY